MKCKYCGTENEEGQQICSKCGLELELNHDFAEKTYKGIVGKIQSYKDNLKKKNPKLYDFYCFLFYIICFGLAVLSFLGYLDKYVPIVAIVIGVILVIELITHPKKEVNVDMKKVMIKSVIASIIYVGIGFLALYGIFKLFLSLNC